MFPSAMKRICISLLLALALLAQASSAAEEYIVVSGGPSLFQWEKYKAAPHDLWWMNFIRAARLRIQELREQFPDERVTWLVYSEGYKSRSRQENQDLISNITSVRDAYNINLIFFDRTSELIDYLNNGQPRATVKIANLEYFGHSNRACWMFDYSNNIDSGSKVWLHEDELTKIHRGIFTRSAFVKSWGCYSGESFTRKWRLATGVPMWGAIGKTQYMTERLPILSSPTGRWVQ
jgi:hypothetical protein